MRKGPPYPQRRLHATPPGHLWPFVSSFPLHHHDQDLRPTMTLYPWPALGSLPGSSFARPSVFLPRSTKHAAIHGNSHSAHSQKLPDTCTHLIQKLLRQSHQEDRCLLSAQYSGLSRPSVHPLDSRGEGWLPDVNLSLDSQDPSPLNYGTTPRDALHLHLRSNSHTFPPPVVPSHHAKKRLQIQSLSGVPRASLWQYYRWVALLPFAGHL